MSQHEGAEEQMTAYTQLDTFLGTYEETTSQHHEDRVGAMWSAILAASFPPADGYLHAPQYENSGGFTDITTMHWQRDQTNALHKRILLVTQTKKYQSSITARRWAAGEGQLGRYLTGYHQDAQAAGDVSPMLYGIIAIGRWVKLYQHDGQTNELVYMFGEEGPYHVKNDADIIISRLRHMNGHH
ncbi:hypothetical protein BJX76DRAFT_360077 [Aspergillus varians]